ncbi:MAG: glycosyltransferase [Thermotogota bacterium]
MKVLLYSTNNEAFKVSGVGKALQHQKLAVESAHLEYTTNPNDTFDICHINTLSYNSYKLLKACKGRGIPIIYSTHTTFEDFQNSFFLSNLYAPLLKQWIHYLYYLADRLISPSFYTKQVVESYGIKTPIDVISNGVDTKKFKKSQQMAEKFLTCFHQPKPIVMSVGLPFVRKGLVDFCQMAESQTEWTFIWFGSKSVPLLPFKIKRLLKDHPSNVIFPGFVEEEILLGAFSIADVFLFPSYVENEGIAVLEALSMEIPVIVRDIEVYKDWLIDGTNCLKAKSSSEFIQKAKMLMNDKRLRRKITENGRKTALERDLVRIGESLKKTYSKMNAN